MLFNSYTFIFLFVPLTIILTGLARRLGGVRAAIAMLVLASLFFYAYHDVRLLALIGGSILGNYALTHFILRAQDRERFWITVVSIGLNLALLGYFKYANFFMDNLSLISGQDWRIERIILPIGISFYTFQQIAYCADCYAQKVKEREFLTYALFVSFFPQLIAGPIVHHSHVIKQYRDKNFAKINARNLLIGLSIFGLGLFSKKIFADSFAEYASPYFVAVDNGDRLTIVQAWQAALSYTFQIYYDFAGYSTMAIGLGYIFGVRLPTNFFSPYKALNISEFWRRWHITLSNFLRDYLYIPLGGNRKGPRRRYINLAVTMVLGGLWHGANWSFVLWGSLHGLYLIVHHAWRRFYSSHSFGAAIKALPFYNFMAWGLTFGCVVVAWVGFRATTIGGNYIMLKSMGGRYGFDTVFSDLAAIEPKFWIIFLSGFVIAVALPNMAQIFASVRATYEKHEPGKVAGYKALLYQPNFIWTLALAVIAGIAVFYQSPTTEFLYWAF